MLVRFIDIMKMNKINAVFTSLTNSGAVDFNDESIDAISSLADTWINLSNEEKNNERVRSLLIVKSRGMGHINSKQYFTITNKGIQFLQTKEKP